MLEHELSVVILFDLGAEPGTSQRVGTKSTQCTKSPTIFYSKIEEKHVQTKNTTDATGR
jgi:hypothetical protein